MAEIFRINSNSKRFLIFEQSNSIAVYNDYIDVKLGDEQRFIAGKDVENIFIAEPYMPGIKERTSVILYNDHDGNLHRFEIEDSHFDNKLSANIEHLIQNEWSFITEKKRMTKTREWLNAAAAIYYLSDAKDITSFGALVPSEINSKLLQEVLSDRWGVKSKFNAENAFEALLNGRGNKQFNEDDSPHELLSFIRAEFGKIGIIALDYVRAIHMISASYIAGYLSIDEASELGIMAGRKLQETFPGWDEMYANYLAGYCYWAGQSVFDRESEAYQRNQILNKLQIHANSPHKKIDWNYKLEKDW